MRRPSQTRALRQQLIGVALIVLFVVVFGALALVRYRAGQQHIALDENLCPISGGPHGYLAVLVDVSDPITSVQSSSLKKELLAIEEKVPAFYRVQVFLGGTSEDPNLPVPIFDLCKPFWDPNGSNLTNNQARLKEQWEGRYKIPLEKTIESLPDVPRAADSPIMEFIQAVAVTAFPARNDSPRSIVVASDFLQHTPRYSHYGGTAPRFEDFEVSPEARRVYVDLADVSVLLLYLRRDGEARVQTNLHKEFWKRFFVWSGVERLEIIDIAG